MSHFYELPQACNMNRWNISRAAPLSIPWVDVTFTAPLRASLLPPSAPLMQSLDLSDFTITYHSEGHGLPDYIRPLSPPPPTSYITHASLEPVSDNTPRIPRVSLPRQTTAFLNAGLTPFTSIHEGYPSFLDLDHNNTEDATAFSLYERNALYNILGSIVVETIQKVGLSVNVNQALYQVTGLLTVSDISYAEVKAAQKRVCEAAVSQLIDVFSQDSRLYISSIEEIYLLIHCLLAERILKPAYLVKGVTMLRGYPEGLVSMAELLLEDPHILFTSVQRTRLLVERFYANCWMEESLL